MEDKQIIKLYFARSESAIAETEKKYGVYCKYIARNILGNNEDAEEIVNDTYLKLWDTIPPNRPEPLKAYLGSICRNFAISRYRELHAQKRGGTASILEELSECITDCGTDSSAHLMTKSRKSSFAVIGTQVLFRISHRITR